MQPSTRITDPPKPSLRIGEVLSALSFALDLAGDQPAGHTIRSCVIGMHIASELRMDSAIASDLFYALLLKDAGNSAGGSKLMRLVGADNATGRRGGRSKDWIRSGAQSLTLALSQSTSMYRARVRALSDRATGREEDPETLQRIRGERGADVARQIGLSERTAKAIQAAKTFSDEPDGLLTSIISLAQQAEISYSLHGSFDTASGVSGAPTGCSSAPAFDPDVLSAFRTVCSRDIRPDVENATVRLNELEPAANGLPAGDFALDNICSAFADVIDAKSPFTYRHSTRVAGTAVAIARSLGLNKFEISTLRRAALLHDIGKLSVSNTILDKPGRLTSDECAVIERHPRLSYEILRRVPGFCGVSEIAAAHHEKLDGSGYFRNLTGCHLSLPARVLAIANTYDALTTHRPYREGLPAHAALSAMARHVPRCFDPFCFEALQQVTDSHAALTADLTRISAQLLPAHLSRDELAGAWL